ncbi:MAG: hypothetical protein JO296_12885 [Pseudonocardiales bacterium]|nr:hypothetical protein [Pseudonocardiales bacterium]MBV9651022.1 hypothetical protein [Pseudonocardiales bacterium]
MAAQRSGIAVAVLRAGVEDIACQGHGVGDDAADPAHPAFERPELLAWQGAEGGCLGRNELQRKGEVGHAAGIGVAARAARKRRCGNIGAVADFGCRGRATTDKRGR